MFLKVTGGHDECFLPFYGGLADTRRVNDACTILNNNFVLNVHLVDNQELRKLRTATAQPN